MYQYPNYTPQSVGDFMNPRNSTIPSTTPITQGNSVMAGAYDNQSWMPQTVGQTVSGYSPNVLATPQQPISGVNFDAMYSGQESAFSQQPQSITDTIGAGIGSMSFGQKATALGGVAKGVFDAYNAFKMGKLAKEQFNFTKMNTNRNFEASANTTNAQLADRQAARVARDPKQFASVSDYMSKYGVKV